MMMTTTNTPTAPAPTTHFKGWAKPGPLPADTPAVADGESWDAISGHYRLLQLKDGHRFSTDDILTAWYGTTWAPTVSRGLDLGSGIGSVGQICAWRCPGAQFVTVEAQELSVELARRSAAANGLTERYDVRWGDFRHADVLGPEEKFDLITGSPPYWPVEAGVVSEHPQKMACRFELRGSVADYCATAARHLAAGGFFACVFPYEPHQLARVVTGAAEAGLAIVRQRPIQFREGDAPLVALFGMMRAADLPEWFRSQTWVEPMLTIRTKSGAVHPEYSAVKLAIGFPP
jgi:tRNA1(Val) A37 N6-methylase TrmN6